MKSIISKKYKSEFGQFNIELYWNLKERDSGEELIIIPTLNFNFYEFKFPDFKLPKSPSLKEKITGSIQFEFKHIKWKFNRMYFQDTGLEYWKLNQNYWSMDYLKLVKRLNKFCFELIKKHVSTDFENKINDSVNVIENRLNIYLDKTYERISSNNSCILSRASRAIDNLLYG